jgi:nucleoside-diphosphate-sugar epimerase
MKVLVTGASGRVGRAVVVRLAVNHQVQGLDQSPSSTAHWVGDLGDRALLARALQGVDAVVHTAALHAPQLGHLPDAAFERINVQATQALAELACAAGVSRLVYTSTTALYGDASTPAHAAGWVDESTAPQPRTIYHRTKLAAEQLLRQWADAGAFGLTILRMSRCFPEPAPLMAVGRLHRGVDARDVAQAHELALAGPTSGSRLFVVSGATPFMPEDATTLKSEAAAVLRRRAPDLVAALAHRGWALPASIDRVYSSARAQQQLGWLPQFGFAEVLHQLDALSPEVLPAGFVVAAAHSPVPPLKESCS